MRNRPERKSYQKILVEIKFYEEDYREVELTATMSYGNHGIGPYEYWGAPGNDVRMGYEIEDITWDEKLYNDEENQIIQNHIDKNDHYTEFGNEIEKD